MPKVIDHQQHKQFIAEKACELFLEYGYSQLGMRQLADELGLSKSALYHYFPSKDALFTACIEFITRQDMSFSNLSDIQPDQEEGVEALFVVLQHIEARFMGELRLVLDYIRELEPAQIRHNPHMQLAEKRYLELIGQHVGEAKARQVYYLLLGSLLGRLMDGQATGWDEIKQWVYAIVRVNDC
jgi:AcrR family transcriptional regulator